MTMTLASARKWSENLDKVLDALHCDGHDSDNKDVCELCQAFGLVSDVMDGLEEVYPELLGADLLPGSIPHDGDRLSLWRFDIVQMARKPSRRRPNGEGFA